MYDIGRNVRFVIFMETVKNPTPVKRVRETLVVGHEVSTVLTALTFLRSFHQNVLFQY